MKQARERLEAILARLAARLAGERVFLKVYAEEARAAADASDARQRSGRTIGPLDGAIVSIKDIFDVAGEPTLAGSVIRRTAPAAKRDATVVSRLRAAGTVILGKTNTNEFCFTSDGINPNYGTPGNAADPLRIPGGSSSGAGVSVAEGTSDIALGSDTGGSVRIPAALNGVVGFKPTARRVPLDGVFPLSPSLDSVGPLARTVAECAIADSVIAGVDNGPLVARPLDNVRIGLPPETLLADVEPEIAARFDAILALLGRCGAILSACPIDDLLDGMRDVTRDASIASVEAARIHADWLRAGTEPVDPRTSRMLKKRLDFPVPAYRAMLRRRADLARAMDARLDGCDAIAMPTVPIFAPRIEDVVSDPEFGERVSGLLLRNPQIANQFDLCSISLPVPGVRLLAGFMLVGRHGEDRNLLALAAGVEAALAG